MEVVDLLAAAFAVVDDHAEAFLREAEFARDLTRDEEEVTHEGAVLFARGRQARDVALGDHEHVMWCLRIDIAECHAVDVIPDNVGWDLATQDFAEDRRVLGRFDALAHETIVAARSKTPTRISALSASIDYPIECPRESWAPRIAKSPGTDYRQELGRGSAAAGKASRMKIALTGGTGFVGEDFARDASERGDEILWVTRRSALPPALQALGDFRVSSWDALDLDGVDAVVHLAGENLFAKRWSEAQKRKILESRTRTSAALVEAIARAKKAPKVLVHASGTGYYGDQGDHELDEGSPHGSGFLADVCVAWEAACSEARAHGVRVVPLRTGVVLDGGGGAIAKMRRPFQFFVGGPLGNGAQWLSWIHRRDLTRMFRMALVDERADGPINAVAPHPVRMDTFAKALARAMRKPAFFRVPAFALKLVLGEAAAVLLESQRVRPARARELGFEFEFSEVSEALEQIVARF